MFSPEDPLAPPEKAFDEPWQAQALAIADTLVKSGRIAATDWAQTLGSELRRAEAAGQPDTSQTYFEAVVAALETLSSDLGVSASMRAERRKAWEKAYHRTPHGQPVELSKP